MRKIIVLEHISLDGVIQAPGGPEEDPSGGFTQGGWIARYDDDMLGTAIRKQMNASFDLLLGRKTFDIWAPYWPQHGDIWPNANSATKFVASNSLTASAWQPTVFLNGDIAQKVAELKQQTGPNLHIWGSGNLLQTLMKHQLIDTFWLMIYPLTLGAGKKLFDNGTTPAAYQLSESTITPSGVILATYQRAGTNA